MAENRRLGDLEDMGSLQQIRFHLASEIPRSLSVCLNTLGPHEAEDSQMKPQKPHGCEDLDWRIRQLNIGRWRPARAGALSVSRSP